MPTKLRVAIDCRIREAKHGAAMAVLSLAQALSDSPTTDKEFTFIVPEIMRAWIAPYIGGPCRLKCIPDSRLMAVKAALRPIAPLRKLWRKVRVDPARAALSDGFVETRQFDLVHFPTQTAYLTRLPSIYHPHDLQHLHYPEFFSAEEIAIREKQYRAYCAQAVCVCVQAEWTRKDVIEQYGESPDKVVVVPWGPVFDIYQSPSEEQIHATVRKHNLPESFFFYPAVTWPHKNHELIFRALHELKNDHGLTPHVYFTGASTNRRAELDQLARKLGVSGQLHFLGFVDAVELQAIYRTATAMVFPSRFEGFGLPVLEAFHARLPVLCANVTTLPEVAREAGLYLQSR